jgi:hypothetical protein
VCRFTHFGPYLVHTEYLKVLIIVKEGSNSNRAPHNIFLQNRNSVSHIFLLNCILSIGWPIEFFMVLQFIRDL